MLEQEYWTSRIETEKQPSTIYKPALTIDGDSWCALYGQNLQNGVAGFGGSPNEAYKDFDKNWYLKLNIKRSRK